MIIEGLIKSCRTSIKKRRMYDTCSSRAYHSERKCKKLDIHIYHLHATGAYIFDADSFDVGRSPFTTITSWNSRPPAVFLSQSGAHQSATCQKGVKSCPKGGLPKGSRDGGVNPCASIPKRVLGHTPLLITLVHPLYAREKKNSGWLGGAQGARQPL